MVGGALLLGLTLLLAYAAIRSFPSDLDLELFAARDTVRITDSIRIVTTDTLRIREKAKHRVDTLVRVESDTTLIVNDSLVVVPPLVVERIVTDSALIATLYQGRQNDSAAIVALKRITNAPPPRVEKWAGIGYDPLGKYASVTAGATLNLYKGFAVDAYLDQPLIVGEKPYVRVLVGYWRNF